MDLCLHATARTLASVLRRDRRSAPDYSQVRKKARSLEPMEDRQDRPPKRA